MGFLVSSTVDRHIGQFLCLRNTNRTAPLAVAWCGWASSGTKATYPPLSSHHFSAHADRHEPSLSLTSAATLPIPQGGVNKDGLRAEEARAMKRTPRVCVTATPPLGQCHTILQLSILAPDSGSKNTPQDLGVSLHSQHVVVLYVSTADRAARLRKATPGHSSSPLAAKSIACNVHLRQIFLEYCVRLTERAPSQTFVCLGPLAPRSVS